MMKKYSLGEGQSCHDKQCIEKIERMWQEAAHHLKHHQGIFYGVYYDYESDYKGDYSLGVAIEGKGRGDLEVPRGKYKVFKVDTTDEQRILKTWKQIWEQEEAGLLRRTYTFDYEKYHPNGDVDIYIAVL